MKNIFAFVAFVAFVALPKSVFAAPSVLTYQFGEQVFEVRPQRFPAWRAEEWTYTFAGFPIVLPEERRLPGALPKGVEASKKTVWNLPAIEETLKSLIAEKMDREPEKVRIFKENGTGAILFEGRGLPGRTVDIGSAAALTITALEENIPLITLDVEETPPIVIVEDEELKEQGIRELVAVGESDFTGSPVNRKHNIGIGLSKFNGHLIPQGEEFSFNAVLGPVDERQGYRKELTIMGERTIPEFGGGLCQVSTTAYRGVWKTGFPIVARRNHSFAVTYYSPPGTDATIYPPHTDFKFDNDSEGALLLQTFTDGNKAYFLYYGTALTDRTVELLGPITWDFRNPPEDRKMYTTEIPPEVTRMVSKAVRGMRAMWYRSLQFTDGREAMELFFSYYEARPNIEEIGVTVDDPRLLAVTGALIQIPALSGEVR